MTLSTLEDIDSNVEMIDSRDVIAALADYEERAEHIQDALDDLDSTTDPEEYERLELELSDLHNDAKSLVAFAAEFEAYAADYHYGAAAINADYFTQCAQELAHDICALSDDWPGRHIDWDAAAEELKQDYTVISFDGTDFYVR